MVVIPNIFENKVCKDIKTLHLTEVLTHITHLYLKSL